MIVTAIATGAAFAWKYYRRQRMLHITPGGAINRAPRNIMLGTEIQNPPPEVARHSLRRGPRNLN